MNGKNECMDTWTIKMCHRRPITVFIQADLEPFIRAIFNYCNSFLITKKYNFGTFNLLFFVLQPCFN